LEIFMEKVCFCNLHESALILIGWIRIRIQVSKIDRQKSQEMYRIVSYPVFRIRDILVRIRMQIRILVSVPLTKGSFSSFFKDKKPTKKSQDSRSHGFPSFFCS
jgi:hypothetical protein